MSGLESGDLLGHDINPEVAVRPARRPDAATIAAIQARSWKHSYSGVLSPQALTALNSPELTNVWRTSITDPPSPAHRVMVATTGSSVVGFIAVAGIEIIVLAVDPAHQRRGHGSRLLAAAVDGLRADGRHRVQAWALAQDQPVRDFYAGAGMTPDGARRIYDGGPGVTECDATEVRVSASLE